MTNMISEGIVDMIENALDNALAMGHDPMRGHYPEDAGEGKSCFNKYDPFPAILEGIQNSCPCDLKKDHKTCIIQVYLPDVVGYTTKCPPQEGAVYTIRRIHGSLQAAGPGEVTKVDTDGVALVITREEGDVWVLASLFPGMAEDPPETEGLKEGDRVTAAQLLDRGFTRVVCE